MIKNVNILFLENDKTMAQNCQLEGEDRWHKRLGAADKFHVNL